MQAAGQHPNPDLVFESTKDTPHQMLSLDVPFEPWKRSARIDLAREELSLADVEDAAALQALRRSVRMAFYGLLAAEEAAALTQSMQEVAERVREVAQARFDEGAAPRLDVMQADLGRARAKAELDLARSARRSAQAELNALLNRPAAQPLAVAGDLAEGAPLPSLDQATARAAAGNAELVAAERELAIEDRRLGLLKAERIPTPVFSLGAVFNAPGEFDVGYRAGLSLAVPLFSRNQGEIAGSLARGDQARFRRDALRRAVEARVYAAHARAEARRAQVTSYRDTLVPTATLIESLAEEGYRLGRNPILAVLDAQRGAARRQGRVLLGPAVASIGARRPGGCAWWTDRVGPRSPGGSRPRSSRRSRHPAARARRATRRSPPPRCRRSRPRPASSRDATSSSRSSCAAPSWRCRTRT